MGISYYAIWLRRSRRHRPEPPEPPIGTPLDAQLVAVVPMIRSQLTMSPSRAGTLAGTFRMTSTITAVHLASINAQVVATVRVTSDLDVQADQPPVVPVGAGNRAYRHGRPNVVQAVGFDTAAEVTQYIQPNGTYTSNPNRAIRITDPAHVLPGFTGCMRITNVGVSATSPDGGGEPDLRNVPDWVSGHAYALHDGVRNPINDRVFACETAHTSTGILARTTGSGGTWSSANTGNGPDSSSDGGDYPGSPPFIWRDYGSTRNESWGPTGSNLADDSVQYVRKLHRDWEAAPIRNHDYDGFTVGHEWWISWLIKYDDYLAHAQWEHNTGAGGMKMGSCASPWRHNIGAGQQFWNNNRYNTAPTMQGINSSGFIDIGEQIGTVPDGDFTYQKSVLRQFAGDHPKNILARNTASAGRIDPRVGTAFEISRKQLGMRDDMIRSPYVTDVNDRMRLADPISGAIQLQDIGDLYVTFCYHFKMNSDGGNDSLVEGYIALPNRQFDRLNRDTTTIFNYRLSAGTPGAVAPAYGSPSITGVTMLPYAAFWFTMANTSRIQGSMCNPDNGVDRDGYAYIQELLVTTGPVGPIAHGRIDPITSVDPPHEMNDPTRQHGRTNYRRALQPGQYCVLNTCMPGNFTNIAAVIPPEWGTNPVPATYTNQDGPDGRYIWATAFSGLTHDYENRVIVAPAMGGHSCTGNNMNAAFFGAGDYNRPGGWVRVSNPSARGVLTGNPGPMDDGKWRSTHTYDCTCVTPDGRWWKAMGYAQPRSLQGGETSVSYGVRELIAFNPADNTYVNYGHGNAPALAGGIMKVAPELGIIFMITIGSQDTQYAMFDYENNQWIRNWGSFSITGSSTGPADAGIEGRECSFYRPGSGGRNGELLIMGQLRDRRDSWILCTFGRTAGGLPTMLSAVHYNPAGPASLVGPEIRDGNGNVTTPAGMLRVPAGLPVCWDLERDCGWWCYLDEARTATSPNRGKFGRIVPGGTAGTYTFSEILIDPVGTWNGAALVGPDVPIPQFNANARPTSFANMNWGRIMVDRGQDALFIFGGNYADPPFYLAKPV